MSLSSRKMFLLEQIASEKQPISLNTLLERLGESYSERTVRRWLTEMYSEGLIERLGKKRSTVYQVVRRQEDSQNTFNSPFKKESIQVVQKILQPYYTKTPINYADDWLNAYEPNMTFYIPKKSRIELLKIGKRTKENAPAGTYARQIFNRLLIDLSYNSSRLEGNTYSLLETERLVLAGREAEDTLDEDTIMILNHKEAIRYLVDDAHRLKITEETIRTLHYLLSDGLLKPHLSGKIRNHAVGIGGSAYLPIDDENQLKRHFLQVLKKADAIKDPFEQSFFLLAHIAYLQCFSDVNKRTARLSANIPLIKNNLVPLSFNDVTKNDYTSSMLALYELQDIRPLLDIYTFTYMRTAAMYDHTVANVGLDEVRIRYRQERRALIRDIILKKLHKISLLEYINKEARSHIKEEDLPSFIEDTLEDLELIDSCRITGLGITQEDLIEWKKGL